MFPEASFQVDGAKKSCPSSARRTKSHRARRSPFGTTTQVPAFHPYRSPTYSHEPSTQSASFLGRGGMNSTGAGRGGEVTST